MFKSKLYQIAQRYRDGNILLAGDFNARCEENQDIILNDEIDFIFQDEVMYESEFFELP